jgi:hypothetical protein
MYETSLKITKTFRWENGKGEKGGMGEIDNLSKPLVGMASFSLF